MIDPLVRFFSRPEGDASARGVRAHLLSRVLNVYLVVALAIAAFYPRSNPGLNAVAMTALAQAPLTLLMRFLLHRRRVRLASWIFLLSLSIAVPILSVFVTQSVAVVSVSIFQMLLVVMAGLLLGGREALLFSTIIVLGNAPIFWEEATRIPEQRAPLLGTWILQAVFYSATAAVLSRSITLSEDALALASRAAAERALAETALRDSMERYRLITTVSSDYVFSTELADGPHLRLNWVAGAFEAITGFEFDEYVSRGGWRAALHPDDVAQDARDLEELRRDRPIASELRTIRKDGTVRWVRVYAHPVWDHDKGFLSGIYGAVQDINARKLAELERETLILELEGRNAELERFTYTVSHDLKSPLITIRGFLGHIEEAAIHGRIDDVKSDMERVYKSTSKMHQLLDDLLDLSRIGRTAKPPQSVAFDVIVRDALDGTHGRLTSSKAVVEVGGDLGTVLVDRDRLVEVLQNLIDNAAKFMGDQTDPHIWIGVRDLAPGRAYFVRDNGQGIEPAHHQRIFNLFDKLDPKTTGTGVGLSLVKRIIEVHGGRVWVESAGKGQGSTFLFTLGAA